MKLEQLIETLSGVMGGNFTVEDGACTIAVDDMVVNILEVVETNTVLMYAKIGEHPAEDNVGKLAESMLAANHMFQGTFGATISYNQEDRCYYLNRYDDLDSINGDKFLKILENFVNTLEMWRKLVVDYRPSYDDEKNAADASATAAVPDLGGFMQV